MNWLLVGSVGGGVTLVSVDGGGMTYSAAQKLADEINSMYAAEHSAPPTLLESAPSEALSTPENSATSQTDQNPQQRG